MSYIITNMARRRYEKSSTRQIGLSNEKQSPTSLRKLPKNNVTSSNLSIESGCDKSFASSSSSTISVKTCPPSLQTTSNDTKLIALQKSKSIKTISSSSDLSMNSMKEKRILLSSQNLKSDEACAKEAEMGTSTKGG